MTPPIMANKASPKSISRAPRIIGWVGNVGRRSKFIYRIEVSYCSYALLMHNKSLWVLFISQISLSDFSFFIRRDRP